MPEIVGDYGSLLATFHNRLESAFDGGNAEGRYLPMMLDAAVPLWQWEYRKLSWDERMGILREIEGSDLCLRMEYLLHRGPKKGDSARAFNDLAKAAAILSFVPGGVRLFGRRWEMK